MKAILEIEMPENCVECDLITFGYCIATKIFVGDYFNSRHFNCPLKPVK